jgi:hypothetical protein
VIGTYDGAIARGDEQLVTQLQDDLRSLTGPTLQAR